MKKIIKNILILVVTLLTVMCRVSCGKKTESYPNKIRFYLWNADGLMPTGFEEVLKEYNEKYAKDNGGLELEFKFEATQDTYKQNLNLYFSAQKNNYDVVFDAQWILLERFSQTGYYYDLSKYFNNDNYLGLKKAFSEDFINNNKYNNGVYGIPITESFGDIAVTFIRKDWRVLCASDTTWEKPSDLANNPTNASDLSDRIDNYNEFEYYIYWVKAHAGQGSIPSNVVPIICNNDGAYSAYEIISGREARSVLPKDYYNNGIKTDILINSGGLSGQVYIDERSGEAVAADVSNLNPSVTNGRNSFPAQFQSEDTSWQENYEIVRRWNVAGMMGDVSNETEAYAKFKLGLAGSVIQSIDNFNEYEAAIKTQDSNAELEIFIHDTDIRNKAEGVQATDYRAWNYLAIPKNVPEAKVEKIMKFFDWLFASREHHDLFQYGIKGINWDEAKDDSGNYIENTVTTLGFEPYTFTAYLLTWNPTYIRLPYASDPKVLEYSSYMYSIERYSPQLYSGFVFSTVGRPSEVTTALNNPDIASAKSDTTAYQLGLVNNPVSSWQGYLDSLRNNTSLQNSLTIIQRDLITQFNEYLEKNGN